MHEQFMLAALKQAWLGRGQCAPNPAVGAVAVHNHSIIAQAFHSGAGSLHAERKLLESLPGDCSHLTLYVTLEPCNHWGKTPPCIDIIVQRGVKKVFYGYADPNPIVSENHTPTQLRHHGVEVVFYPLPAIDDFYRSYTYWIKTGQPWVTVKMAQSLDGKVAGAHGKTIMFSNALSAEFTHQQRQYTDVILTTAATVNQDNPALNVRLEGHHPMSKPVAILDRIGKLKPELNIYKTSKRCLIYHRVGFQYQQPSMVEQRALLECYAVPESVSLSGERLLDILAVLKHLGETGFHDVWVEAGPRLFHTLHQQNLVHTTHLYLVPTVLGQDAFSMYAMDNFFERPHRTTWQVMGDNLRGTFEWS
jgi:diaminohydroxyphosphoribosylaminopyrimidine deaminase / 5-amino-6-(5-phosphoribosylamino)uracil reductase